jgi:phenylpropionate dioxygenase-like ring-hydroxylating dioxygenase large terminal subunit
MEILRDCWYAAAWADEVPFGKLFGRTIAGEAILFFRKDDGSIAAIADYCPHRFAPLHRGKQCGNVIRCGYHGLEFDSEGQCVRNPHEKGNLPNVSIPSYAACEKYSVVWYWLGEKSKADSDLIPDEFAFLESTERSHVRGRFHVKANYQLLTDNLLDISHALYVHGDALMTEDLYASYDPQIKVNGDEIKVTLESKSISAPLLFRGSLPAGTDKTDFYDYVKFLLPSLISHDIAYTQVGEAPYQKSGVSSRSAHFFTPESETTTHYMFDNSRDFMIGDPTSDERILGALKMAFGDEDIPMIEAQQTVLGGRELFDLKPAILVNDRAAVMARRTLSKRIREQRGARDGAKAVAAE